MELGVGGGTMLMLYDAVVILILPSGGSAGVFFMVLCTMVYVLYPEELLSLPDTMVVPIDTTNVF